MSTRRHFLAMTACLCLLVLPGAAGAGDIDDKAARKAAKRQAQEEALQALQRGEILPLNQVLEIAGREVPGKVIEVEYKAGPKYEIKMLAADGRVREVKLDARTGRVLGIENKD
jgi:uncharacterized membrane protein YkoI